MAFMRGPTHTHTQSSDIAGKELRIKFREILKNKNALDELHSRPLARGLLRAVESSGFGDLGFGGLG